MLQVAAGLPGGGVTPTFPKQSEEARPGQRLLWATVRASARGEGPLPRLPGAGGPFLEPTTRSRHHGARGTQAWAVEGAFAQGKSRFCCKYTYGDNSVSSVAS